MAYMLGTKSKIQDRKIRFALVGCGRVSERHFEALRHLSDKAELVGVCDSSQSALVGAQEKNRVPGFSDLAHLLDQSNPDIVVLGTPSGFHAEQTIQIAKSGRHVMTEKPMATKWSDGLQMVEACEKAGVHLFVVKQNRLNPTLRLLKNTLEKGRFGKIYLVNVNIFWSRPQSYYDSAAWRGTRDLDGGALMNQASHYIDLLDWLIGPVESVQAEVATLARTIEVEDTAVVNLRWRSGTLGSANVTMLTYPKNLEGSITIIGEKGTVRLGGVALNQFEHWEFSDQDESDFAVKDLNYHTASVYGFGHTLFYENAIDVLRGTASPVTDGHEGLRSLEIIFACYRSAREGRRIALPLELEY